MNTINSIENTFCARDEYVLLKLCIFCLGWHFVNWNTLNNENSTLFLGESEESIDGFMRWMNTVKVLLQHTNQFRLEVIFILFMRILTYFVRFPSVSTINSSIVECKQTHAEVYSYLCMNAVCGAVCLIFSAPHRTIRNTFCSRTFI